MTEKFVFNPFKNIQHPHQRLDQPDAEGWCDVVFFTYDPTESIASITLDDPTPRYVRWGFPQPCYWAEEEHLCMEVRNVQLHDGVVSGQVRVLKTQAAEYLKEACAMEEGVWFCCRANITSMRSMVLTGFYALPYAHTAAAIEATDPD